jgi:transposase
VQSQADPQPDDRDDELVATRRRLEASCAEVELLKLMVAKLKLQLVRRNRALYGVSSEQFDAQGTLLDAPPPEPRATTPTATPDEAANAGSIDRSLPAHLPRETRTHRPPTTSTHHDAEGRPCGCSVCGGRLRLIGTDVSEQLEYVPAHFKVIRHARPKLACAACETIVQAAAPSRPVARGVAGPGLLAHVVVGKFCDHLPLDRQSRIYARSGVELDRSMLAGWIARASELLDPLVEALGRYVRAAAKLHADDTPVKVLAPGEGKTRTGRLWAYVRDDRPAGSGEPPAAWFRYSGNRRGEHPKTHLAGFRGALQADAYGGWNGLYAGAVTEVACWAHARRPWWDLYLASGRSEDSVAAEALRRIRELYRIEDEVRGQPPEVRRAHREARAGPLLAQLHEWFTHLLTRTSTKSELTKAARYSLARWTALTRYVEDGTLEIDNNAAERALRGVALGRNNYLFMGSDSGGERAAALYSLVETAKLNGLDPEAYLREVFARIAEHRIDRIEELLPWKLQAPEPMRQAA